MRKRAANLMSNMTDVARKVCASAGEDAFGSVGGVAQISRILRERCARDAIDSASQDVATFTFFKRTGRNTDTYFMECDML